MQNDILPYFTHTADIYEEEATVKWLVETIKIVDIRFKISMQYTSTKKRFLLSHKSLYNIHQLFLYSIILYLSLHFHLTSKRSLVQSWEETNPFLVAAGRASGLKPANSYIQATPLWQPLVNKLGVFFVGGGRFLQLEKIAARLCGLHYNFGFENTALTLLLFSLQLRFFSPRLWKPQTGKIGLEISSIKILNLL